MPLSQGSAWTYSVKGGFDAFVVDTRVAGHANLGVTQGFVLASPMGESRVGWHGDTLVASQLAGQTFVPALPWLPPRPARWTGTVDTGAKRYQASARISVSTSEERIAGRLTPTRVSELTLDLGGRDQTVTSTFAPGIGLIRQEVRSGGRRIRRLDYLSGP